MGLRYPKKQDADGGDPHPISPLRAGSAALPRMTGRILAVATLLQDDQCGNGPD